MKDVVKTNIGASGSVVNCEIKNGVVYLEIPLEQTYPKKEGSSPDTINIATVGKPRQIHFEVPIFLGLTMFKYIDKK